MKIRSGFVSNSSSSSFILRGIKIKKEELIQKLKISKDELDLCEDNSYEILTYINNYGGEHWKQVLLSKEIIEKHIDLYGEKNE